MRGNSNITLEQYNQLISQIYSAATDISHWETTIKSLASILRSPSGIFRIQDMKTKKVHLNLTYGLDPFYQQQYQDYYAHHDIVTPAGLNKQTGTVHQTVNLMPENFKKTMYFNEYIKPQHVEHIAGSIVARKGDIFSVIATQRSDRVGYYAPHEMHLIETLLPHFQRAIEINQKLFQYASYENATADILNRLPNGVILLDKNKRPVFINKRAEAIIETGSSIKATNKEITLGSLSENQTLHRLIARANQTDSPQGGKLVLGNPPSASMIHLLVTPINQENQFGLGIEMPHVTAAIFIETNENPHHDFQINILRQLYNLTLAEARLTAKLANGLTTEEIAKSSNTSKETLRSQLKSCFRKTNTHNQTALVKLVLSGPAILAK